MRSRLVCDASALVALLLDSGPEGTWAASIVAGCDLAAPSLAAFETANIIRRHGASGLISDDQAAQAHADLLDLPIELWPYEPLASRAWALRSNLTTYDATYIALAELLGLPLITLDRRLANAPGLRCEVLTPQPTARE